MAKYIKIVFSINKAVDKHIPIGRVLSGRTIKI